LIIEEAPLLTPSLLSTEAFIRYSSKFIYSPFVFPGDRLKIPSSATIDEISPSLETSFLDIKVGCFNFDLFGDFYLNEFDYPLANWPILSLT
jgi:hypothetical protein